MDANWERIKASYRRPANCSECGGPMEYKGRGSFVCEKCGNEEFDEFGLVNRYLEENGPSNAPTISRATGIPLSRVKDMLMEGRLEAIPGSEGFIDGNLGKEKVDKAKGVYTGGLKGEEGKVRFDGLYKK